MDFSIVSFVTTKLGLLFILKIWQWVYKAMTWPDEGYFYPVGEDGCITLNDEQPLVQVFEAGFISCSNTPLRPDEKPRPRTGRVRAVNVERVKAWKGALLRNPECETQMQYVYVTRPIEPSDGYYPSFATGVDRFCLYALQQQA
jgi:hypothetical protein